jgi:DNA processing protein
MSEQIIAALLLSRRPFVGAAMFRRLVSQFGSPAEALRSLPDAATSEHKSETKEGLARAEAFIKEGGTVLYFGGPDYPALLNALGEPPPVLFVRGDLSALSAPMFAIVGTRSPDKQGIIETQESARAAIAAGFSIVSGGARGVDSAAHRAALDAGVKTIAVLGCGVDVVYPPENQSLFEEIATRGAIVSEIFPGTQPNKGFFLTRNRIIAGLAKATLVTRAGFRSGAITTATWARKLSRPVAALTTAPNDPHGEAGILLQQRGAARLFCAEISDWCAVLRTPNLSLQLF